MEKVATRIFPQSQGWLAWPAGLSLGRRLLCLPAGLVLPLCLLAGCASYHPLPLRDHLPAMAKVQKEMAAVLRQEDPVGARPVDLQAPLSGADLGVIAVLLNPNLRALRAEIGVAQAQVFAAGLLPDPQLSLSADLPSNVGAGYTNAYNLGLSWSLASLFTRSADLHLARAHAQAVQYQVAWQEWMVANQTRMLARQLYYLQKQEEVAQQAAASAQKLYQTSLQNLRQGESTRTTTAAQQVAWLDSQDQELVLRRQVTRIRQELNKTLGIPPEMELSLAAPRLARKIPGGVDQLVQLALTHRLDLLALRAGYQAQEAQVRRAILGQYPGFSIGISKAADTSNIQTLGPSVSLHLPLWNRNRGAIAEAKATRAQLHAAYSARLFQTRAEISALVADLQRLQQAIAALEQQVPQLQDTEQRLRAALAKHELTILEYESVHRQNLAKRLQLLALQQTYAEQQAALEMAVGVPWQEWRK